MSLVQYIHNQLQRWAISQRLFDFNISQRRGPNSWKMLVRLMSEPNFEFWAGKMSHILWSQLAAIVLISSKVKRQPWLFEERRSATKTAMQTQVAPTCVSCWHVDVPIRDKRSRQHWDWDSWPTLELARLTSKHYDTQALMISAKSSLGAYMQKAGDCWDISPQIFLDFPQNFRLRTRNQYCTQAIAWGSTI